MGTGRVGTAEVNGLRVFWPEPGSGHVARGARLYVRTGTVDETIARTGITGMVAYLVGAALAEDARLALAAEVGLCISRFTLLTPDEVRASQARLLSDVDLGEDPDGDQEEGRDPSDAEPNRAPPVAVTPVQLLEAMTAVGARLAEPWQVAAAEGIIERDPDLEADPLWHSLLGLWFGPRIHGLAPSLMTGVGSISRRALRAWAAARLTAANAALVLPSAPDADLLAALSVLPAGPPHPVAEPDPLPFETPAYVAALPGPWAWSTVTRREPAMDIALDLLARRVRDRLGVAGRFVYEVEPQSIGLSSDRAMYVLDIEGPDEDDAPEVGALVETVLEELATSGPTEAEITRAVYPRLERIGPHGDPFELASILAVGSLDGSGPTDAAAHEAQWRAVTPRDVARVVAAARSSALLVAAAPPAGLHRYVAYAVTPPDGPPVEGRRLKSSPEGQGTLVDGVEGISIQWAGEPAVTVRYGDVVLLLIDDEHRVLLDRWGTRIVVGISDWDDAPALFDTIDRSVPPSRTGVTGLEAAMPGLARRPAWWASRHRS